MTGRERTRRALALQRADRTPFHVSFAAAEGELPPWAREWPIRAGVDVIEVRPEVSWPRLPMAPAAARAAPDRACEELLEQPWPDSTEPGLYRSLDRLARAHPDRALFYRVPGLFQLLEGCLGFETFLATVERAPTLAGELMERLVALAASIATEGCVRGALVVLLVEELAGAGGPRAGLEQLDRWIFPFDRLLVEGAPRDSVSVIAWCPAATDPLWRRFASIGARLAGPLRPEPDALAAFRDNWRERLGIYGALDSGGVIAHGTPEAIRVHVQESFAAAGPEGGLIFSAADLPPHTPMGNLEALIEAIQDCRY
jgi:uroporphyrinogen-III decarboxylase